MPAGPRIAAGRAAQCLQFCAAKSLDSPVPASPNRYVPTTLDWAVCVLSFRVARGRSARVLNPSNGTITVALPWYEREDFARLLELADDRADMTADYDVWHGRAKAVAQEFLARGRALQIVTIRTDEFLAWLNPLGLPNTSANRLRYVEMRAAATAAALADIAATERPAAT